ncbi:hypothetical protein Btru_043004 [Bulinus truncatus]|nr:hypothetical protein Btru_043004 [Bulinus truncatus]
MHLSRQSFVLLTLSVFQVIWIKQITSNDVIKANYKIYSNLTLPVLVTGYTLNQSRIACACQCLSNINCTGFRHSGRSCEPVYYNSNVTSIDFTKGDVMLRKRKIMWLNVMVNPLNMSMYKIEKLAARIVIGDVIYLRATLVKHWEVRVRLIEQLDLRNETYEFAARCVTTSCSVKEVSVDYKINGLWQGKYRNSTAYTLQVNETFEYHMVVTTSGLVTYLKNKYLYTLVSSMPLKNINYVVLIGNIQVDEFSL